MANAKKPKRKAAISGAKLDPDLLLVLGKVVEMLGLAEHAERLLKTDRRQTRARHKRIEKEWNRFKTSLNDGRTALLAVQTTFARHFHDAPPDAVAASIPLSDFEVFKSAIYQLQSAITEMTDATYSLEALTSSISQETERFFKISEAGRPVLEGLSAIFSGRPDQLERLLSVADQYFARASQLIDKREKWLGDF